MEKVIAVIDLKSFYASCECACRHLDIFSTPLVCCDPYRSSSSVVMSATPYLKKKYGIPNVCRRRDLPNVPGMIFAVPRMSYYLTMSSAVNSIFLDFVSEEDLHIYSVDESFLNLGPYLNLYHAGPEEIVKRIQKRIKDKLGLLATAGIGPNMFLAKIALDQEGKKRPPYIAHWDYNDIEKKLWAVSPITKIWGIADGTSSHLARLGIHSLFELAHAKDEMLKKEFGIMGDQLKNLANGLDDSDMEEPYVPKEKNLTAGQTLRREYSLREAVLLMREMNDDLSRRLRNEGAFAGKIGIYLGYSGNNGSFAKERSLPLPTDNPDFLFEAEKELLTTANQDLTIRGLAINYEKLSWNREEQIPLFYDLDEIDEKAHLTKAMDNIRNAFGPNSILRCSSLLDGSTAKIRHVQIGGHRE